MNVVLHIVENRGAFSRVQLMLRVTSDGLLFLKARTQRARFPAPDKFLIGHRQFLLHGGIEGESCLEPIHDLADPVHVVLVQQLLAGERRFEVGDSE